MNSGREPLKIKHAHLEPNVSVRDDEARRHWSLNDDMNIGPMTTVDFEDSTQQVTTPADTYVVMQDPEMKATGYGMVMQLRKTEAVEPGGPSSGFEGVERLDLLKGVDVIIGTSKLGASCWPGGRPGSRIQNDQAKIEVAGEDRTGTRLRLPLRLNRRHCT